MQKYHIPFVIYLLLLGLVLTLGACARPESSVPEQLPYDLIVSPGSGGAGTTVHVTGDHFRPGTPIVVQLGVPEPVGEPLVSTVVNADGSWSAVATIPPTLPSGAPIVSKNVRLVVLNVQRETLTSVPFELERGNLN